MVELGGYRSAMTFPPPAEYPIAVPAPPGRPRWLVPVIVAAVLAAVVVLVGAGVLVWMLARPSLADRDPHGAAACRAADQSADTSVASKDRAGLLLVAGEEAAKSTTPEIRATSESLLPGFWVADMKRLAAACEAAGA